MLGVGTGEPHVSFFLHLLVRCGRVNVTDAGIIAYRFPKALARLEELKKSGKQKAAPVNGKLTRKDQKKDEAECVVM